MIVLPRLRTVTNLPLRWGEWFAVALLSSVMVAIALEALFQAGATIWFGDPTRALLPLVPLAITLLVAAIILRVFDTVPLLQRFYRLAFALGAVATALLLIRLRVFPTVAADDWGWLATFGQLTDPVAEQPHTELGLIVLSAVIWTIGERIVHNAGDYDLRRQAFLWLLVIMVLAIVFGLLATHGRAALSASLALALPTYVLVGLLMMAQVRLSELRARIARTGATELRTLRIWRLVTLGLALVTLLVVFILTAIFYTGSYQDVLNALDNAWNAFIDLLILLVAWITLPIVDLFHAVVGTSKGTPKPGQPTKTPIASPPPLSQSTVHLLYTIVLVVVLAIVAIILIVRARRRASQVGEEDFEEVRETIPTSRVKRPVQPALALSAEAAPLAGTTRAVYRDFLRRSAQAGMPRDPEETPAEFAARITPYFSMVGEPDSLPAIDQLTTAYAEERYGATSPTTERFTWAQGLLQRIGKGLQRLGVVLREEGKKG